MRGVLTPRGMPNDSGTGLPSCLKGLPSRIRLDIQPGAHRLFKGGKLRRVPPPPVFRIAPID